MNAAVTIRVVKKAGKFAENKDIARDIRIGTIIPALEKKQNIVIDFNEVDAATQSFIHALISQPIRDYGVGILDSIAFKDCTEAVQRIIEIVVDYMQHEDK